MERIFFIYLLSKYELFFPDQIKSIEKIKLVLIPFVYEKLQNLLHAFIINNMSVAILRSTGSTKKSGDCLRFCDKKNVNPDSIDAAKLTHINYAFVNIRDRKAWLEQPE